MDRGRLILWLCAGLFILSARPSSSDIEYQKLALRLSVSQDTFLLGEPIFINAELSNEGKNPVEYFQHQGMFEILISQDGVSFTSYRPWGPNLAMIMPKELPVLGAGDTVKCIFPMILYNHLTESNAFPKTGVCYVKARYGSSAWSNTLSVRIIEPQGRDREVLVKAHIMDIAAFLQHPADYERPPFLSALRDTIESYSDSTYTPLIRKALIAYYSRFICASGHDKETVYHDYLAKEPAHIGLTRDDATPPYDSWKAYVDYYRKRLEGDPRFRDRANAARRVPLKTVGEFMSEYFGE